MSSILVEDNINPSIQAESPHLNLNNIDIDKIIAEKLHKYHEETVILLIKDFAPRIYALEEEIIELKNTIREQDIALEKLGCKAKGETILDVSELHLHTTEGKAKLVYPELLKVQKMCSSDIISLLKLNKKDHTTARRIMEKVAKTYPDKCVYETGRSGKNKYWLALRDYRGL